MIKTVALVPAKSLQHAKQRLVPVLNPAQRARLSLAMLEDVLDALTRCPLIERCQLLTSDETLFSLAEKYGVEIVRDDNKTLNEALTQAAQTIAAEQNTQVLFVPGDVPLLNIHTLEALLLKSTSRTADDPPAMGLAPDQTGKGSNALLCYPANCIDFQLGPDSAQAHIQQAEERQIAIEFWHANELALDIDTPEALQQLKTILATDSQGASYTRIALASIAAEQAGQRVILPWHMPNKTEILALAESDRPLSELMQEAAKLRDLGFGENISYSKKVFIPLTQLCRDVCHYCTFAKAPRTLASPYLSPEHVLALAKAGAQLDCKEALFTLGEQPELRYKVARQWLDEHHYASTLDYLADMAERVFNESGLLPHLNPGLLDKNQLLRLKNVSASMGLMLESSAERLTHKGQAHYGSPDKIPAHRLETLRLAGELQIPFTSGILIGIGETRRERIESLLALRDLHLTYGHIQEIIVQNFRAKPNTRMAHHPEPDLVELQWTLAMCRLIFGPDMAIQTPPNLNQGRLTDLIQAGINDWGGVSPLTPDHVNPEAPWPQLAQLAAQTRDAGKLLVERLSVYPRFASANYVNNPWLAPALASAVNKAIDAEGLARNDHWQAGVSAEPPEATKTLLKKVPSHKVPQQLQTLLNKAFQAEPLAENEIVYLLQSRDENFTRVCQAANDLRQQAVGNTVTYVVNRNINYTNICGYKCQFCAFSKGKTSENLRGKPYVLDIQSIVERAEQAQQRGATEVCLQGGIHPDYTGQTYLDICHALREALPDIHIHAFSPLEIQQGAHSLNVSIPDFLRRLQNAGLNSLPGTAAEILDDEVRKDLCPDKLNTAEWLDVMQHAHNLGLKSTATVMFGHIENYTHIARHLLHIRTQQEKTQGFTEFVPLPFVHSYAPIYLKGRARPGPSFREAILLHAVARLVLHPVLGNIQASWTKLGHQGAQLALQAGANDLGGTLMNESITRAAGAQHGQESSVEQLHAMVSELGRTPVQRNTLYQAVSTPCELTKPLKIKERIHSFQL
ncbi:MAG TPA: 5-amino-6-(D-ribitylamino)uracil--L-tyrosine 4-hydroxyphenyl transferase CofH [Pseudomonadales bacterium]|nr:5-amino-6-(D-ribitylamino)uracil--L-tyrosine 4-hydroxyphenyl transferase CofH [Pseudomonadales bacterium]